MDGVRRQAKGMFELSEQADPQALLDAARSAGRVRRFEPATATLAELFREAIAEEPLEAVTAS